MRFDFLRRRWKIWCSAVAVLLIATGVLWFVAARRQNSVEPRTPAGVLPSVPNLPTQEVI